MRLRTCGDFLKKPKAEHYLDRYPKIKINSPKNIFSKKKQEQKVLDLTPYQLGRVHSLSMMGHLRTSV